MITGEQLERIKPPLKRVLWGIVVVIVDVRLGPIDLVNDVIGWGLIVWAAVELWAVGRRTRAAWPFAVAAAAGVAGLVEAAVVEVGRVRPMLPVTQGLWIFQSAGMALFCMGMRDLCDPTRAWLVARSWQRTMWIVAAIYIPLGMLSLGIRLAGGPNPAAAPIRWPGAGSAVVIVIVLALLLAPTAHFIASAVRTLRAPPWTVKPCRRCGSNRVAAADASPCAICGAPGLCPACGYDLTGLDAAERCPECGAELETDRRATARVGNAQPVQEV